MHKCWIISYYFHQHGPACAVGSSYHQRTGHWKPVSTIHSTWCTVSQHTSGKCPHLVPQLQFPFLLCVQYKNIVFIKVMHFSNLKLQRVSCCFSKRPFKTVLISCLHSLLFNLCFILFLLQAKTHLPIFTQPNSYGTLTQRLSVRTESYIKNTISITD